MYQNYPFQMKEMYVLNITPDLVLPAKTIYNCFCMFSTYIQYYQFLNIDFTIQKEISTFHIKNYCTHKHFYMDACCICNNANINIFRKNVNNIVYMIIYPLNMKINNQYAYIAIIHKLVTNFWSKYFLITVNRYDISYLLTGNITEILKQFNDPYRDLINTILIQFNNYINARKTLIQLQ